MVTTSFPRYEGDKAGVFIYNIVNMFSQKYEIHVIYLDYPTVIKSAETAESFYRYPIRFPYKTYSLAEVRGLKSLGFTPLFINMATKLRSVVREHKIDLIHAQWAVPSGFLASLCCWSIPLITTVRGSDINNFGKQLIFKYPVKYALKKSTRIIAVSNDLKRQAVKLGAREDRISVIPSGTDTNKFKPMDKQKLRSKLCLPDGFIILFAGNLVRLKRVDRLLKISANLSKDFDFHLLIAGDGPERENLKELVNRLGLSNVLFKGMIPYEDMPLYMAASDILALPSELEGLPGCVREAMACGMPTVASNVGGLPDIITNGVNGYLVEDEAEMEERLRLLMSPPELISKLGANALEFARSNLSLDIVAKQTEAVYASLIK